MIVSCPSCPAKYRVRDEAVSEEGAELRCPQCAESFVAFPPKHSEEDLRDALERVGQMKAMVEKSRAAFQQELVKFQEENEQKVSLWQKELLEAREKWHQLRKVHEKLELDTQRLRGELTAQKVLVERLQSDALEHTKSAGKDEASALRSELEAVRAQMRETSAQSGASHEIAGLLAAVAPMLWGLDNAITDMQRGAATEAELENHLRHLRLLSGILKKLSQCASSGSSA